MDFKNFCVTRNVTYDPCNFKNCSLIVFYSNSDFGDMDAQCDKCHNVFCPDHLDDHPCQDGMYCDHPKCTVIIDSVSNLGKIGCDKDTQCCNGYFCPDHRTNH